MAKTTITEALAELPTIAKRIKKKQDFVLGYLYRQGAVRDPHEKDGGSPALIAQELQAISDLSERVVAIRRAIAKANAETTITIGSTTKSIADWLTWRREIAPQRQQFYNEIFSKLSMMRNQALQKGLAVMEKDQGYSLDFVININEKGLGDESEAIIETLGVLDGQLSLKNATTLIDI